MGVLFALGLFVGFIGIRLLVCFKELVIDDGIPIHRYILIVGIVLTISIALITVSVIIIF